MTLRRGLAWTLRVGIAATATLCVVAPPSLAQTPETGVAPPAGGGVDLDAVRRELDRMRGMLVEQQRLLREQTQQIGAQQRVLERQQRELDALRGRTPDGGAPPTATAAAAQGGGTGSGAALATPRRATLALARGSSDTAQAPGPGPGAPGISRPPDVRPDIADPSLATQGGVLTPRRAFVVEPSFEYSYQNSNQAVVNGFTIIPGITFGAITINRANEYVYTPALTARYGITDRWEINARIPYVIRSASTTTSPVFDQNNVGPQQTGVSGNDIGDVEFGTSYQINAGANGWPFFVANLRFKTATGRSPFDVPIFAGTDPDGTFRAGLPRELASGTGFYSLEPGITAIYPSEPVVFFANVHYTHNFARNVNLADPGTGIRTPTDLHAGDGIGFSFGMGFALNERASFSLGYEHTIVLPSSQNGGRLAGSAYDLGAFNLGFSYRVAQSTNINLGVAIGATQNTPDIRIILRVPIRFQI